MIRNALPGTRVRVVATGEGGMMVRYGTIRTGSGGHRFAYHPSDARVLAIVKMDSGEERRFRLQELQRERA